MFAYDDPLEALSITQDVGYETWPVDDSWFILCKLLAPNRDHDSNSCLSLQYHSTHLCDGHLTCEIHVPPILRLTPSLATTELEVKDTNLINQCEMHHIVFWFFLKLKLPVEQVKSFNVIHLFLKFRLKNFVHTLNLPCPIYFVKIRLQDFLCYEFLIKMYRLLQNYIFEICTLSKITNTCCNYNIFYW